MIPLSLSEGAGGRIIISIIIILFSWMCCWSNRWLTHCTSSSCGCRLTHYTLCPFRSSALAAPPIQLHCPGMARWSLSGCAHTAICFMSHPSTAIRPASDPRISLKAHSPPQQEHMQWTDPRLCIKQTPHCTGKPQRLSSYLLRKAPKHIYRWQSKDQVMIRPVSVASETLVPKQEPKGWISVSSQQTHTHMRFTHACLTVEMQKGESEQAIADFELMLCSTKWEQATLFFYCFRCKWKDLWHIFLCFSELPTFVPELPRDSDYSKECKSW